MSDTPRTDIYVLNPLPEVVSAQFARELERENAKLKQQRDELLAALKASRNEHLDVKGYLEYRITGGEAVYSWLDDTKAAIANIDSVIANTIAKAEQ